MQSTPRSKRRVGKTIRAGPACQAIVSKKALENGVGICANTTAFTAHYPAIAKALAVIGTTRGVRTQSDFLATEQD
jgi:hypothetical protein